MRNRRQTFLSAVLICAIYLEDYSTGNRVFGKFGSVRVFLDPADVPMDNTWGRSWPEGIKMDDNFNSVVATARNFQDGSLLPAAHQTPRRIAPVRRTYNWQADELVISFNMTNIATVTCTRLEPPVTWLAASGAKVKVLHSGGCTKDERTNPKLQKSCSSVIEVSVSRNFAESSLSALRSKGFTREDIYRMLDKGPWILSFDIPTALPKLFLSLQNDLGLSQCQAVHVVSHCPYLLAQYAKYKGRDVFATMKAFLDVGYTMPKLVSDVMRFPSMLAAPPDRIRGWMALLNGFGIAENPTLFGKLLSKAPFMLYVNPPKIGEDDLSHLIETDSSTSSSSGVGAHEALKILQLLKAHNFPDLDKIIRTQPTILLSDSTEINSRINFLHNLFLEISSNSLLLSSSSILREGTANLPKMEVSNTILNNMILTDTEIFGGRDVADKITNVNIGFQSNNFYSKERLYSKNGSNKDRRNIQSVKMDKSVLDRRESFLSSGDVSAKRITTVQSILLSDTMQSILSSDTVQSILSSDTVQSILSSDTLNIYDREGSRDKECIGDSVNVNERESVNLIEMKSQIGLIATGETFTTVGDLNTKSSECIKHREAAHEMLGALLLTYPAVLSIEHSRMRAAGNALRSTGLRRGEVLLIARRHPPVLGRDPVLLVNLISFLRFTCGLHKADLVPFLFKYPAVLGAEVKDIEPKVDYLFQTLGGSQEMLRRFPSFLSFDLEAHTRPRAEFLRALKIDPLINGLAFLVNAPAKEIAYTAGVRVELFNQFHTAYSDMWKKRNLPEKDKSGNSTPINGKDSKQKTLQISSRINQNSNPEESFLDEFDMSF